MASRPLTEDVLRVFWTVEQKSTDGSYKKYQEEVEGLLFYGYRDQNNTSEIKFPLDLWPDGTHSKEYVYIEKDWTIIEWTVRLAEWPKPSAWCDTLENSMRSICQQGIVVAWCGTEGFFNGPAKLFLPEATGNSIYAAYLPAHGMACSANLNEGYQGLSTETLLKLRAAI